jgi:hypothetical protein
LIRKLCASSLLHQAAAVNPAVSPRLPEHGREGPQIVSTRPSITGIFGEEAILVFLPVFSALLSQRHGLAFASDKDGLR